MLKTVIVDASVIAGQSVQLKTEMLAYECC